MDADAPNTDGTLRSTERPEPAPDRDTLARATLTYCLDGADALMYAAIAGTGDAAETLRLIIESRPDAGGSTASARLDHVFATGLARWGRRVTPQAMTAFHNALAGWHARLPSLPTLDWETLAAWFTMDGRQWIIGPTSPHWPHQLQDLSTRKDWASPLCLWGIGDERALTSCPKPVAVVGSRGANEYGRSIAREVARKAASDGHLVVSGGALGADAAAHWGALAAMDGPSGPGTDDVPGTAGRTVAVFAGGLNHIGPSSNLRLFDAIVDHGGALVSELCPGTIPEARRFLLRNRIIAALASTVVVTQARTRSGALNTANWACDLNRELIAVPGDITMPHNAGCNLFIARNQAMLLTSPDEIAELLHEPHRPDVGSPPVRDDGPEARDRPARDGDGDDADRRRVLTAIRSCRRRGVPSTPDMVLARLGEDGPEWSMPRLLAVLGELEMLDVIRYGDGEVRPAPA
ncbi:DNA-processing protein DprA [Bifidobacterium platyrrhinorum]|uniref:DNA processing protein DprA n=1 Tax=Bifidobacterium platyrrhinorum TaxID=2661628 RepID=A0A6L9SQF3_9BIFI|nr:DNA-processing protein DprA [Bifidobacterium platyrrhinorum]NEG54724.1 DNA processing protein DprA [Bifidobacterium platyrrhinorum]